MNKIFPLVYNKNLDNFTSELENISRAWKKIQKMINVGPLNRAVGLGKKSKLTNVWPSSIPESRLVLQRLTFLLFLSILDVLLIATLQ